MRIFPSSRRLPGSKTPALRLRVATGSSTSSGSTGLQVLHQSTGGLLYELIEIPTSLFASVDQLTVAQAQLATIPLPPGTSAKDADLRIRVDRSDAKITIAGIKLSATEVHARWQVPRLLSSTNDPD
jgi:hypothetical protein